MSEHPGARIARELTARGAVQDPAWHRALLAVPREAFVPETVWAPSKDQPGHEQPYTRDTPEFQRWIHQDVALVTQVDDGTPAGPGGLGLVPTSSISQPGLVVAMLEALDADEGDRILEIGTGTGYNTALLCERFGDANVVSVEVDAAVADQARRNLHALGYKPTLITGDGTLPADEGTFDRVLSTVAARRIPPAWLSQVRPGGTVVTPWGPGFTSACLVRLTVGEDGSAQGRLLGDAAFMWLRDQRRPVAPWHTFVTEDDPAAVDGETGVNPRVVADRHPGWGVVLGHLVPDLAYASFDADEEDPTAAGEATVYVYDRAGSWALGEYTPAGGPYEVRRCGRRDLWAEIAEARRVWVAADSPGRDRLGLTVAPDGSPDLWVDAPNAHVQVK
ncbi:protein-L-isoaspartate(D-aspartate) O-methyltransferase [Murinocardiopsis flavida]|uniref:Protein-L-isoaspartate O-methyltransferase n=1 Tax=Murinocardiopsis flavida TaxID=645275 RepID=A0A2P8CDL0_9ACTN|nr:methyltransferase domain-containing protein [Murinocardiopsis flavida]PSK83061.1 protein-L-isoaspartate(D-aspartate) O-methyltransferase [Murinocardiopsis flavida]